MIYHEQIPGSPLVPIPQHSLTRAESVMLVQAQKHPALNGQVVAWTGLPVGGRRYLPPRRGVRANTLWPV
jgi:hypothetical protein